MNIRLEKPREFLNYNFPKGKTVKNIRINKISEIESIEINILPNFMWEKITSKFITPLQKLYELESDVLPFDILRKGYKLVNDDSNIFIQIRFKNKVKNLELSYDVLKNPKKAGFYYNNHFCEPQYNVNITKNILPIFTTPSIKLLIQESPYLEGDTDIYYDKNKKLKFIKTIESSDKKIQYKTKLFEKIDSKSNNYLTFDYEYLWDNDKAVLVDACRLRSTAFCCT